jgi:hypothetical protein
MDEPGHLPRGGRRTAFRAKGTSGGVGRGGGRQRSGNAAAAQAIKRAPDAMR